jgi:hypothetical protein
MARNLKINRRLTLEFVGDDWKDCFIEFKPFRPVDVFALADLSKDEVRSAESFKKIIAILKERFARGTGIDEAGQTIDLEPNDLDEMSLDFITKCLDKVMGKVDPKSLKTSNS